MVEKNLEEVTEISGAISLYNSEILISDDSNLLHIYHNAKLQQNIKITGGLQDPEAICIMEENQNNSKVAIYGDGVITIIKLSLTQNKFTLNTNYSKKYEVPFANKKKIESLEYNPQKKIFVLIDRRKKDNYNLGSGIIYEYNPSNNQLIITKKRVGQSSNKNDCKPTDMIRDKNKYHILTEEKIFTLNKNYDELATQEIEKIKDAEAIYLDNDNDNYIIFTDKSKAEYNPIIIPKSPIPS